MTTAPAADAPATGTATEDRYRELLCRLTGDPTSQFRPGQREAIEALVDRRRRALVVQRTGWGKSAVYFIATRLLRDQGAGPTLIISPLLALMRNQVTSAARAGVTAATINYENPDDHDAIEQAARQGELDVLLISPERFNNDRFRAQLLERVVGDTGLLVVDEAHCISDWGHDFRPDYRRIARVLTMLPKGVPVLCTTATANDRVVADIVEQLGADLEVIRGPLERESLALSVVNLPQPAQRMAWLAREIPTLPGSGIVYCLTIADAERVAGWLQRKGIDASVYTGKSDSEDRLVFEDALLNNKVKAVVATSALGMGFDKPDLAWVIHYQSPGSPIAYYQQVGRAGRALDRARGVLLRGHEDSDIQDWFIKTAFPPRDQAEAIVGLLEAAAGRVSIYDIQQEVNVRPSRLDAMLKVLEVEGAVERADRGWRRTQQPWAYDAERVDNVTRLRRAEQQAMMEYGNTTACLMAFLRRQLDDPLAEDCGRCANCTGTQPDTDLDPAVVAEAIAYLRSAVLEIEPRKQWPAGFKEEKGRIPVELQLRPGRALSVSGDGGWGSVVKQHADAGRPYPDELIGAAVNVVRGWAPDPAPVWVTCVPSAASADNVADVARRIATALDLPFHDVVRRVRDTAPQTDMQNGYQQLRNIYGAFALTEPLPPGPVLLIDTMADSRWTLTVVGVALARGGSGPVHPLVLAKAAGG